MYFDLINSFLTIVMLSAIKYIFKQTKCLEWLIVKKILTFSVYNLYLINTCEYIKQYVKQVKLLQTFYTYMFPYVHGLSDWTGCVEVIDRISTAKTYQMRAEAQRRVVGRILIEVVKIS